MTQNLCSKQETLLQPQEEDINRIPKGEQTSGFFFWRYFPLTLMAKHENVKLTFQVVVPISLQLTYKPLLCETRSLFVDYH